MERVKRTVILGLCAVGLAIPASSVTIPAIAGDDSPAIAGANLAGLETRAKQIVEWMRTKEYEKVLSTMSPRLRPFWTAEKIGQVWDSQVIDNTGPIRKIVRTKAIDAVNADLVTVTIEFERHTDNVILTFNDAGELIGADFPEFRDIERIGRGFIEKLARKDYAAARGDLSPLLKAEVFPARIQSGWENFVRQRGPFERIVETRERKGSEVDGVNVVLVTTQFENRTDTIVLVFDDNKRIVNVDFPIDN
jgi:hypothetical protein